MKKLTVIGKSGKRVSQFNRNDLYQYVMTIDRNTGEGYEFAITHKGVANGGGQWVKLPVFSIIELEFKSATKKHLHPQYDRAYRNEGATCKYKVSEPKWEIVGHESQKATVEFNLSDFTFGYGRAWIEEYGIAFSEIPDRFEITPLLNKINEKEPLEGTVKICGMAKKVIRLIDNEWQVIPHFEPNDPETTVEISDFAETSLVDAYRRYQLKDSYRKYVMWLAKELRDAGRMIDFDYARQKALELGLQEGDLIADGIEFNVKDSLYEATMKPSYDVKCFEALKEKAENIYYGNTGFVFVIGNYRIWEVPEAGTATYVFDNTLNPAELVSKLEVTPRNVILQTEIGNDLGFIGRAIHAKTTGVEDESDKEKYFERWFEDVKALADF